MTKKASYYKLNIEIKQKLKHKLTNKELSLIDWIAKKSGNGSNEKCNK